MPQLVFLLSIFPTRFLEHKMSKNVFAFLNQTVDIYSVLTEALNCLAPLEIEYEIDETVTGFSFWLSSKNGRTLWGNAEPLKESSVYFIPSLMEWVVSLDSSAGRSNIDAVILYSLPWILLKNGCCSSAIDPQVSDNRITSAERWGFEARILLKREKYHAEDFCSLVKLDGQYLLGFDE
jgi:hypothetical protein